MIVRELVAKFGFKVDKGSEQKTESAISKIKKAAVALAAVFAAGKLASGLDKLVNQVAKLGDEIAKTSKQLGVNAQNLQELQFAANLAGASNSDLTTGLRLLQKNMLEAADGTQSYVDDFNRLGVQVTDSTGKLKSAEELLPELADGFKNLSTDTERTALAQTLLGRSGTKLVPLMTQGTAAIEAQRQRARELGGILSTDLLRISEDLIDAQREQQGAFQGLRNILGEELIPIWIEATDFITEMAVRFRGPLRIAIRSAIRVFGALFRALGRIATLTFNAVDAFLDLASAMTGINKKLLAAVGIVALLIAILGAPIVLFLALGVAIFLLIDDLEAFGRGADSATGRLIKGITTATEGIPPLTTAINALKAVLGAGLELFTGVTLDDLASAIKGVETLDTVVNALVATLGALLEVATLGVLEIRKLEEGFRVRRGAVGRFLLGEEEEERPIQRAARTMERVAAGGGTAAIGPAPFVGARAEALRRQLTNSPTTNVEINVSGAGSPERTATVTGREVERQLEKDRRQTARQLAIAGGT